MKLITARNVNSAFPFALKDLMDGYGIKRNSRNGAVVVAPEPVAIHYTHPVERVLFSAERDCNPFFHLYESLWMIQGRNDISPLLRYTQQVKEYSDDGKIFHGAYGFRWRYQFYTDQLTAIIKILIKDPDSRRCILQMWDPRTDLAHQGKDVPCNVTCAVSRDAEGRLDLTVFQRSGDLIWGVMGANVVQFSMLQEYIAASIGCNVGSYHQIVNNLHTYTELYPAIMERLKTVRPDSAGWVDDPYMLFDVAPISMPRLGQNFLDEMISQIVLAADTGFKKEVQFSDPWAETVYGVLLAHEVYRVHEGENRYVNALGMLESLPLQSVDWVQASISWIDRRYAAWRAKNANQE